MYINNKKSLLMLLKGDGIPEGGAVGDVVIKTENGIGWTEDKTLKVGTEIKKDLYIVPNWENIGGKTLEYCINFDSGATIRYNGMTDNPYIEIASTTREFTYYYNGEKSITIPLNLLTETTTAKVTSFSAMKTEAYDYYTNEEAEAMFRLLFDMTRYATQLLAKNIDGECAWVKNNCLYAEGGKEVIKEGTTIKTGDTIIVEHGGSNELQELDGSGGQYFYAGAYMEDASFELGWNMVGVPWYDESGYGGEMNGSVGSFVYSGETCVITSARGVEHMFIQKETTVYRITENGEKETILL